MALPLVVKNLKRYPKSKLVIQKAVTANSTVKDIL